MTDTKARADIADRQRPINRKEDKKARVPLYMQKSLAYFDPEPGYVYRFVNDVHGRISSFLRGGWSIVEGDNTDTFAGKGREEASQKSSQIWRTVNKGSDASSRDAVLMRIEEHLYNEDQLVKTKQVQENELRLDPSGKLTKARKFGPSGN